MASGSAVVPKPSLLARAIGFFSSTVGLVIKLGLLGAGERARAVGDRDPVRRRQVVAAIVIAGATLAIDAVYLDARPASRAAQSTCLPGTVFLVAFVAVPIVSNVNIAFTNWSTLHNLTKDEAIVAIEERSLVAPADGATYTATPARHDGELVLLLKEDTTGDLFVGTSDGLRDRSNRVP